MRVIPYISFNGNCEEAIKFYQSILGGELSLMHFSDLPPQEGIELSEEYKQKIMHSALTFDDGYEIYFSDTFEGMSITFGNSTTIHLNAKSAEDVHRIIGELADGGTITMPVEEMFWGAVFGSCIDKFGIQWSVDFQIQQ